MVSYIRSDLDFILAQIKISEAHAAGQPLYGPGGLIPAYNIAWGLRTVDGTYNHLLPGQEEWGSSDQPFLEGLGTDFRPADGGMLDPDGPGGPAPEFSTQDTYAPSDDPNSVVIDSSVRTISNLIVDQTLGNPAAILTALQRAGIVAPEDQMTVTATISAAYEAIEPLFDAVTAAEIASAAATAAAAAANPPDPALDAAAAQALQDLAAAQDALNGASGALDALLVANGIELDGANVKLTNIAPDEGLSASFNSWFTLFGQFFDHGLDLVGKGGSGTVFIPLQPDDPLYDPTSSTNFMVLTRATVAPGDDGIMGTTDDIRPINTTTAFVDQNQTYASHASHQVFLRQYELNADGVPVATGMLIVGAGPDGIRGTEDDGGMATWADVKFQAATLLGIQLLDVDVGNVPLLATDEYGNFIRGANGYPQIVMAGLNPGDPPFLVEGNPAANGGLGVLVDGAVRTGHAFLADIAHNAVPDGLEDGDTEVGGNIPEDGFYDDELLDAHFIAGDGRANENIGLTAVHHVFHAEHNRLVEHTKEVILATGDDAFIAEWQLPDGSWNGERLFQAAKFGTEMQYQHLVFEEFARKVQPAINTFLVPDGFDTTLNPSIVGEFAHVVYRFGHSMLTESVDRFDPTFQADHISLIEGFLNPMQFQNNGTAAAVDADIAAGAIIRGMTRQVGNEIDEFVTSALRNNLLGLPLDLATINLARGRDTGVPGLNAVREQFYEASNQNILLKPYESWVDFAGHLKNEASIINFIAAYGTHELITSQTTIEGKRDAALTIITGVSVGGLTVPTDAVDFLNATGAYAGGALGGLNNVDLWIGGLAEEIMPFGGMLGSTFAYVFEIQLEMLQSGDRFYYLQRLDGLHLFGEMENNSFASMIMRNTNAAHLPSDVFSTPGFILEVDQSRQFNLGTGVFTDVLGNGVGDDPATLDVDEGADDVENTNADPTGGGILTPLVIRNNPATAGTDSNYLRYTGGDHVVLGGTDPGNLSNPSGIDILIGGIGDDTLYGDGGDDRLEGGFGNDIINGGAGDDIITDAGGDDNIKGGDGNDVIHAGGGLDLVLAGAGNDFVFLGTDEGSEVFAGEGDDFIYGNKNAERILGNEGNDWIETGTFDGAPGDNFDEIFAHDGIDGHDVFLGDGGFDEFIGEGGDDIMVGSAGRGKMVGMSGFDWATYKDNISGINADLSIPIIFDEAPVIPADTALDGYEGVEGLSGSQHDDILRGNNEGAAAMLPTTQGGSGGYRGSALDAEGIALIEGLQALVGPDVNSFAVGDIILGGDGSDIIEGQAGDDIIDGDKWLDVQIGVFAPEDTEHTGTPVLHDSMTTLAASMFSGEINAGQLSIVRTIRTDATAGDVDTARFSGNRDEYTIGEDALGRLTVNHTGGTQADGLDTLTNIEVLAFADQSISIVNVAATGAPAISDTTPTEGQVLTATAGTIDDINGFNPANIAYQWQQDTGSGFSNIIGATNATFTPAQAQVNRPLRVVATFTDGLGFVEQLVSAATVVVGDLFVGTGGANTFVGTEGQDDASGLGGSDTLQGLGGDDLLAGNGGNDTLVGGAGADTLNGGAGNDTASYAGSDAGVTVRLWNQTVTGGHGTGDTLISIENATGSGFADSMIGAESQNNTLNGAGGSDYLNGLSGNDTLIGGAGNDTLDGGAGADTLNGGAGNDTVSYTGSNAGVTVRLWNQTATGGHGTGDTLVSFEDAIGSDFNDSIIGSNGQDNTLNGAGGSDYLNGLSGNDMLIGGIGNDRLEGGAGNDTLAGGVGNDTFVFAPGFGDDMIVGFDAAPAGGQDRIDISATGIGAATFAAAVAIDQVGADTVVTIGSDTITLIAVAEAAVTQADFILA